MANMIGKTILHYKSIAKLGEGGMGVVYKAEDTRLERVVALKFLSSHAIAGEEEKKRFKREAKAAAALNHPTDAVPTFAIFTPSMKRMIGKSIRSQAGKYHDPDDVTIDFGIDIESLIA